MNKIEKKVLEYVMAKDIDFKSFELWVNKHPAAIELNMHHWLDNNQLIIPYHVYESWIEYENKVELIEAFKEVQKIKQTL